MPFRSATFQGKVTAATEHSRVAEMSANVVFINIDWKEKRMHNTLIRKMELLANMNFLPLVCSSPCCESIGVVNVHAPSGDLKLKNWQRQQLLTNVLQSSSQATPGASTGNAHFLIAGDMNTKNLRMSPTQLTPCVRPQLASVASMARDRTMSWVCDGKRKRERPARSASAPSPREHAPRSSSRLASGSTIVRSSDDGLGPEEDPMCRTPLLQSMATV